MLRSLRFGFVLAAFSFLATGCGQAPKDYLEDLRRTVKEHTPEHEELRATLLKGLDSAQTALDDGDQGRADELLTTVGNRIYDAKEQGVPRESVLAMLLSAATSAEGLVKSGYLLSPWTKMAKFPGKRCSGGSCRQNDPNETCYTVTVCGEYKGCIGQPN